MNALEQINWAIQMWRYAAAQDTKNGMLQRAQTCENAARELEIERDTGKIVHINVRIG